MMNDRMTKVVWSEGMPMWPQHLQQMDGYHEQLHRHARCTSEAYYWGIVHMQVDQHALSEGVFALSALHGVLPDGLLVGSRNEKDLLPPPCQVAGHFPADRESLAVHLAIAREREGMDNFGREAGGNSAEADPPGMHLAARVPPRYRVAFRKVGDMAGSAEALTMEVAVQNLQIRFGELAEEDFESMQIAEIRRDPSGRFVLCEDFMPACLRVSASPWMVTNLQDLYERLLTRNHTLRAARRERDASTVGFANADITQYLLLDLVAESLPSLKHWLDADTLHPESLYVALCRMAGRLANFTAQSFVQPAYQHHNLRSTFVPLFSQLCDLLSATVRERSIAVDMTRRPDGMHLAELHAPAELVTCDRFFVAVQTTLMSEQTRELVPRLSKVASWRDISTVLSASTPGVPLRWAQNPPPEIAVKASELYFEAQLEGEYWRNVLAERALAIFLPHPFVPEQTSIRLLGLPPRLGEAKKTTTSGAASGLGFAVPRAGAEAPLAAGHLAHAAASHAGVGHLASPHAHASNGYAGMFGQPGMAQGPREAAQGNPPRTQSAGMIGGVEGASKDSRR